MGVIPSWDSEQWLEVHHQGAAGTQPGIVTAVLWMQMFSTVQGYSMPVTEQVLYQVVVPVLGLWEYLDTFTEG